MTTILRFQDGNSDKVWVICPTDESDQSCEVFWGATRWTGRQSATLQHKKVSGEPQLRINNKLKKGYEPWQGVQFDWDHRKVVSVEKAKPVTDPCFWYRIHDDLSENPLMDFIDDIETALSGFDAEHTTSMMETFNALSVVVELRSKERFGISPYSQSPMAAMLLYALRRAFPGSILVSDDDNRLMPDHFDEFYKMMNGHLLGQHKAYWQSPIFKALAIQMRCIEKPINFSELKVDSPAFYF
jgi:hypothetical protein